jgi:type I restriction enzyme S subunit
MIVDNKQLPVGWTVSTIEDIADVNPRLNKAGIPDDLNVSFVPMPAVGAADGSIDVSGERPFLEVKKGFTAFKEGDVLFAKITPCMENGKMAIVPKLKNGLGFGSTEFHVLRPKEGVDAKYIYYYVSSKSFRGEAERYMTGAVGQRRVTTPYLKECEIPLAPGEQQKRIVAEIEKQFSRLDEAVTNLKRVKANLKRYKAAVLKAAVEGKLTEEWRKQHPDVEPASKLLERIKIERKERHKAQLSEWTEVVKSWELSGKKGKKPAKPRKPIDLPTLSADGLGRLSALPPEWAWVKLGNCNVGVFDGPFGSNLKSSDYVENGVRVIRLENIGELEFIDEKKTYISESKYDGLKKHTVSFGDIIFSSFIAGSTRVVSLPKQIECAINKADCFCVRVHGETLLTRFLEMFLGTRNTYEQLAMEIHGATRPRINTTQLKECAIPLCSIAEQNAIVMEVDRRISLLTEMETEVDANFIRAENLRQSILHKAFLGRLLGWPNTGKTNNHKRDVTYA